MVPYEIKYNCNIGRSQDCETCEFVLSSSRHIKVIPYVERWRTPKDAIKYYKGIMAVIEREFIAHDKEKYNE